MSMLYLSNLAATRAVAPLWSVNVYIKHNANIPSVKRYAHSLVLRVVVPTVTSLGGDNSTETEAEED